MRTAVRMPASTVATRGCTAPPADRCRTGELAGDPRRRSARAHAPVRYDESAREALFGRGLAPPVRQVPRPGWAPQEIHVGARQVQVGASRVSETLVVTGYPREVVPRLAGTADSAYPGRVDVAVHIDPIDAATATAPAAPPARPPGIRPPLRRRTRPAA